MSIARCRRRLPRMQGGAVGKQTGLGQSAGDEAGRERDGQQSGGPVQEEPAVQASGMGTSQGGVAMGAARAAAMGVAQWMWGWRDWRVVLPGELCPARLEYNMDMALCDSDTWRAPGIPIGTGGAGSVCALDVVSALTLGMSAGIAEGVGATVKGTVRGTGTACTPGCPSPHRLGYGCHVCRRHPCRQCWGHWWGMCWRHPPGTTGGAGVTCRGCSRAACTGGSPVGAWCAGATGA